MPDQRDIVAALRILFEGSPPVRVGFLIFILFGVENGVIELFLRREVAKRIASLTPAAEAMSRVLVPAKPRCAKTSIAARSSWLLRTLEDMRVLDRALAISL